MCTGTDGAHSPSSTCMHLERMSPLDIALVWRYLVIAESYLRFSKRDRFSLVVAGRRAALCLSSVDSAIKSSPRPRADLLQPCRCSSMTAHGHAHGGIRLGKVRARRIEMTATHSCVSSLSCSSPWQSAAHARDNFVRMWTALGVLLPRGRPSTRGRFPPSWPATPACRRCFDQLERMGEQACGRWCLRQSGRG